MSNPYAPIESPDLVWTERYIFIGDSLALIAYGIMFTLFLQCCSLLASKKDRRHNGKNRSWAMGLYVLVMFALGTILIFITLHTLQLGLIDNRNYPGGPLVYWQDVSWLDGYWLPLTVLPDACGIISSWLADLLLLYRCFIIYNDHRWVVVFPALIYLAEVSVGIMVLYQACNPTRGPRLNLGPPLNFMMAYSTLVISLNVIITLLISVRILAHRRRFMRALSGSSGSEGGAKAGAQYMGIVALLVESSALLAAAGLLFLVPYAAQNNISHAFLSILSQVQIIAPLLIIKRVMERRAWTRETAGQTMSALSFGREPKLPSGLSVRDSDATTTGASDRGGPRTGAMVFTLKPEREREFRQGQRDQDSFSSGSIA